jgi:hypothetical protein
MSRILGGLAAIIALASGILSGIDPVLCLERAAIVFVVGAVCGHVWHALSTMAEVNSARMQQSSAPKKEEHAS